MQISLFKYLIPIIAGYILSACIMHQLPWTYYPAIFALLIFIFIFFSKPVSVLCALFLFRSAINEFLYKIRFSVAGIDLGLAGLFSLLLVFLVILAFFIDKKQINQSKLGHPIVKILAFFCLFTVINASYSYDKVLAVKIIFRNFSVLAVTVMTIIFVRQEKDSLSVLKCIAWSFVPSVIVGALTGVSFYDEIRGMRYCATLSHPNILAFYLLIIIACFLAGLHANIKTEKSRRLTWVVIIALISMVLLTKTRSGYIACTILFLIHALLNNRKLIIPIFLAAALLTMLPTVKSEIAEIYETRGGNIALNKDSSFAWRLEKWGYLFREAVKKPIAGHGMGASKHTGQDQLAAHNDYAQFFLEGGLIGLGLYFFPFFYLLRNAIQIRKIFDKDMLVYRLASFFLMFIPAFLIMSISENLASYVIVQWYFWGIAGVFIGLTWRAKQVGAC